MLWRAERRGQLLRRTALVHRSKRNVHRCRPALVLNGGPYRTHRQSERLWCKGRSVPPVRMPVLCIAMRWSESPSRPIARRPPPWYAGTSALVVHIAVAASLLSAQLDGCSTQWGEGDGACRNSAVLAVCLALLSGAGQCAITGIFASPDVTYRMPG